LIYNLRGGRKHSIGFEEDSVVIPNLGSVSRNDENSNEK